MVVGALSFSFTTGMEFPNEWYGMIICSAKVVSA